MSEDRAPARPDPHSITTLRFQHGPGSLNTQIPTLAGKEPKGGAQKFPTMQIIQLLGSELATQLWEHSRWEGSVPHRKEELKCSVSHLTPLPGHSWDSPPSQLHTFPGNPRRECYISG